MIDAQAAGVAQGCPDGLNKRLVARAPKFPRYQRRQAPILAFRIVFVRWTADRDIVREHVLPGPSVGAVRINPDGKILHQRNLGGGLRELLIEEPLDPLIKPYPLGM